MTRRTARWMRAGRWIFGAFLVVVIVLLVRSARSVDWHGVGDAIAGYRVPTLAVAVALAMLSYLIYGGYDLAARRYSGHHLSTRRVLVVAFISYAFGLNLGALIGGAGFRFRLYTHSGLGAAAISRIVAFSVVTNWFGYVVLAGLLFAAGLVMPPHGWPIGPGTLRALGGTMLVATAAYLVACARWHDRLWTVRHHHRLHLPSLPLALLQLLLACANWLTMAAIVFVLLRQQVPYPEVLAVLLLGAIATAVIHVPAGLGVLEAVFIAMLGRRIPQAELLAALLCYRAVYYLLPLLLAVVLYAVFEAKGKKHA
jgi:uncharacterized membrane protein YbhN (UPF0104 family)